MEWCLDCHRHPEIERRPREQIFNLAWTPERRDARPETPIASRTDCVDCHR